jgi:hypothetical protein
MIVLALLVAFIIGFNIIQIVDSKLSSVTINVPQQNCQMPPIYLSVDKDTGDIKQIKLNDVVSTESNGVDRFDRLNNLDDSNKSIYNESEHNGSVYNLIDNKFENFANLNSNPNSNTMLNNDDKTKRIDNFGNIHDYPSTYDSNRKSLIYPNTNSDSGLQIVNLQNEIDFDQDPNYNTVGDIPLLFAPDPDVPNKASPDAKAYYSSKVKLIQDSNSPLMKLAKINAQKINQVVAKSTMSDSSRIPEINGTFDGYNAFVDLKTDSYANVTSIGKSMLTPYTSYPVPS